MPERGTLVLVVGPSGAGKDTLIAGARARLAHDARFVFPRRIITRPAGSAGEEHLAMSEPVFAAKLAAGAFALAWQAHGLRYALPGSIAADLAAGRHAIANISRAKIAEAGRRFAPIGIVYVDAPPALRRSRLAARGRENEDEITSRLERLPPAEETGRAVRLFNDGSIDDGVGAMLGAILHITGLATSPPS